MSQVKAFTVGAKTYNAAMASAVKQDELLSMLTADLIGRAMVAAKIGKTIDDHIVTTMMMGMQYATKTKIAEIIMNQVFIAGTTIPVTVDDFSGRMVEYNQLLAKLLVFNLGDFSSWLQSAIDDAMQPPASVNATA
jgi:uncharacterized membrane protein YoaK (UPF0700 family)